MYHALFEKAQRGLNTILIFIFIIFVCSIAIRLIVRSMLMKSSMSKPTKRALEDLAAVIVAGLLGIVMLLVVGRR
jgi:hypothetical protein